MDYKIEDDFLTDTACANSGETPLQRGELPPAPEKLVKPGTQVIPLPEPDLFADVPVNFLEIIELRRSVREYSQKPLTRKELSYLLWCTQGVKMGLPDCGSIRNVPSAGARHPLETYLYIRQVEDVPEGLYRYLPFEHVLLPLADDSIAPAFFAAFKAKAMLEKNAVTFLWSACIARSAYKFGTRAYRYVFLDAGHACENLYLAAQTIKTGVCAIGVFDESALHSLLQIDGKEEFVLYAASVGKW